NAGNEGNAGNEVRVRRAARAEVALAEANESVRRLSQLVDDLLDDAQIRDGRFALHLEPCDLGTIIRAAVEEQRMLAPERTIRLGLPSAAPIHVNADARRLRQVVTNYLTNALKYSKEERPVEVRLDMGGNVARVSVRDEGIGIPATSLAAIWERFQRLD